MLQPALSDLQKIKQSSILFRTGRYKCTNKIKLREASMVWVLGKFCFTKPFVDFLC